MGRVLNKFDQIWSNLLYFIICFAGSCNSAGCLWMHPNATFNCIDPGQIRLTNRYMTNPACTSVRLLWNGRAVTHKHCFFIVSSTRYQLVESVDSVSFLSPIATCGLCCRSIAISLMHSTLPLLKNWLCYRFKLFKADKVNSPWQGKRKCSHTESTS